LSGSASALRTLVARAFSIDLRSLALLRVGIAGLLILNLALRARDLVAHYTDAGVVPRSSLVDFPVEAASFSLHTLSGEAWWAIVLFVVSGIFAVALGLGFFTRVASIASWALLVSLHNRNPLVLTGGDEWLRVVLFFGCFLPLGAVASLDARRRARNGGEPPATPISGLATAALLLQIAVIYPTAAVFKWREAPWTELDALARTLSVDGVATGLGTALLAWPLVLKAATAATLVFESIGALLAFVPDRRGRARMVAVALFVGFHAIAIGSTMRVGLFPAIGATVWGVFLPPAFWEGLARMRAARCTGAGVEPRAASEPAPERASFAARLALSLALVCVGLNLASSVGLLPGRFLGPPGLTRPISMALRLDQRWSLWTKAPENRYAIWEVTLEDGSRVDLHRAGAPPIDWHGPRVRCRNNAWWKYELNLSQADLSPMREHLVAYLERLAEADPRLAGRVRAVDAWLVYGTREEVEAGAGRRELQWSSGVATISPPRDAGAPVD